jgi:UMF1 family MFS transporter
MLVISGLALPGLLGDTSRVFNLGLGLSGLWWLVFSLPAFVLLPSVAPAADAHLRPRGLLGPFRHVLHTLRHLRQYRMLFAFLLAFLVYINGVESVINLSSAFAEDVLGMTVAELTTMYLIVQVVAFGGAAACGYLADRVGTKTVIVGTLLIWCVGVGMTPLVQTAFQFTLLGGLIGLVLGGVQSSSRTLMSKLTPPEIRNEAFGFYAIGTKAMSIFGPLAFAGMGMLAGPRWGVLAVLPFLVIGLALLLRVKEPRDGRGFAVVA